MGGLPASDRCGSRRRAASCAAPQMAMQGTSWVQLAPIVLEEGPCARAHRPWAMFISLPSFLKRSTKRSPSGRQAWWAASAISCVKAVRMAPAHGEPLQFHQAGSDNGNHLSEEIGVKRRIKLDVIFRCEAAPTNTTRGK
jgi:hypothetical protein